MGHLFSLAISKFFRPVPNRAEEACLESLCSMRFSVDGVLAVREPTKLVNEAVHLARRGFVQVDTDSAARALITAIADKGRDGGRARDRVVAHTRLRADDEA